MPIKKKAVPRKPKTRGRVNLVRGKVQHTRTEVQILRPRAKSAGSGEVDDSPEPKEQEDENS